MAETPHLHDRILDIVVKKDEVTWQNMIYGIFKDENMNAWDIEISRLTVKYVQMLKRMKELDFRTSGKVLLAAAILLKMKSQKLLSDDFEELDRLMSVDQEVSEEDFYEELEHINESQDEEVPSLIPRTPQPRKRKVSIYDLMLALHKALEVRDRRVMRRMPSVKVPVPEKKVEMGSLIESLHEKIKKWFVSGQKFTFNQIASNTDKTKKVHNFLALLHLANIDQRKIDLVQKEHFGEIEIVKADPGIVEKAS